MRQFLLALCIALSGITASYAQPYIPQFLQPVDPPPRARVASYDGIKRIAILSVVGHHMTVRRRGFFANSDTRIDTSRWGIDDLIIQRLRQYLSSRFEIVDVPYDRGTLDKIRPNLLNDTSGEWRRQLQALPRTDIDAIVVIRPDFRRELDAVAGIGLTLENGPIAWTNYTISIFSTKDFEEIGYADARVATRVGKMPSYAGSFAGRNLALTDTSALSEEQAAEFRNVLLYLLFRSLLETTRALEMDLMLPPIGARTALPIPVGRDPFSEIRTLAVFSDVADEITMKHVGMTVFSQESDMLPVAEWQLDEMLRNEVRTALSSRFAFLPADQTPPLETPLRLFSDDKKLRESFPELPKIEGVDAYIFLVKDEETYLPGSLAPVPLVGLSLLNRTAGYTSVSASYGIVVIDARTQKLLRATKAFLSPKFADPTFAVIDNRYWADTAAALTAEQKDKIRETAEDVLRDSLGWSLIGLELNGFTVLDVPP